MANKLSVLVIDDEISLETVYTTFLSKIGAEVEYFDHPQKGWRAIEKEKYDLIITDLKMPVISGDEFISIVRGSKLNSHTPVILCSGYINKLVLTEMSRESKVYFLSKPFDSKSLLELVTKAIGVQKIEAPMISQGLADEWVQSFSQSLASLADEEVEVEKIDMFELWNFESVAVNFSVKKASEELSVNLVMKVKTFLKVAGVIHGTQYNDFESETLQVWQELIANTFKGTGHVTFSKIISQQIITMPGQKLNFYKFHTKMGEVLSYLN